MARPFTNCKCSCFIILFAAVLCLLALPSCPLLMCFPPLFSSFRLLRLCTYSLLYSCSRWAFAFFVCESAVLSSLPKPQAAPACPDLFGHLLFIFLNTSGASDMRRVGFMTGFSFPSLSFAVIPKAHMSTVMASTSSRANISSTSGSCQDAAADGCS